jgi:Asp-tRNA(Asn)/Glu-tRNA(Gln) amidotransferase B subunit
MTNTNVITIIQNPTCEELKGVTGSNIFTVQDMDDICYESPLEIATRLGIIKIDIDIDKLTKDIIDDNPKLVVEYYNGKVSLLNYFVGIAMKKTNGIIDPIELNQSFIKILGIRHNP